MPPVSRAVFAEDRTGHYSEFRTFFTTILTGSGYASRVTWPHPSGTEYALVFVGCSGEPFPSGVVIYALVPALEPVDERAVDHDLWEILQ
jgi:hypothetical protein